jgi:hypothetical protein
MTHLKKPTPIRIVFVGALPDVIVVVLLDVFVWRVHAMCYL